MNVVLEAYIGGLLRPNAKAAYLNSINSDYDFAHNSARGIDTRHVEIDTPEQKIRSINNGKDYHLRVYLRSRNNPNTLLWEEIISRKHFNKIFSR